MQNTFVVTGFDTVSCCEVRFTVEATTPQSAYRKAQKLYGHPFVHVLTDNVQEIEELVYDLSRMGPDIEMDTPDPIEDGILQVAQSTMDNMGDIFYDPSTHDHEDWGLDQEGRALYEGDSATERLCNFAQSKVEKAVRAGYALGCLVDFNAQWMDCLTDPIECLTIYSKTFAEKDRLVPIDGPYGKAVYAIPVNSSGEDKQCLLDLFEDIISKEPDYKAVTFAWSGEAVVSEGLVMIFDPVERWDKIIPFPEGD